jgi:beta-N-acetylhexosaminidase
LSLQTAKKQYDALALQLQQLGINVNFAPVVDLASNEDNVVIYKLQRSYGKDVSDVVAYAQTFMDALHEHDVLAVLKHFPGHGSSLQDSHKGFVDVSHTWRKKELEPYKELISNNDVQMIMTAHVFNANLDPTYPATLSYEVNTHLLREELGYKGVIISDDLQMDAILKHYTLDQTVRLAINSGIDILLFGNQLSSIATKKIVDTIYAQVLTDEISYERILKANERIDMLLKNVKK